MKHYFILCLFLFIPLSLLANKEEIDKKGKLAYSLIENNKHFEAFDLVSDCINYYENDNNKESLGYYYYLMSLIYADKYDLTTAIEFNNKASKLINKTSIYYNLVQISLADFYYQYDDFKLSIITLEKLLSSEKSSNFDVINNLLGLNYERLQQFEKANQYYDDGLAVNGNNLDLILNKARNLIYLHRYKESNDLLDKFYNNNDVGVEFILAYHQYKGELLLNTNKLLEAKAELLNCLRINEISPFNKLEIFSLLISTLDRLGDKENSLKYNEKRTELFHSIVSNRNKSISKFVYKVRQAEHDKLLADKKYDAFMFKVILSLSIIAFLLALYLTRRLLVKRNKLLTKSVKEKERIQTTTRTIVNDRVRQIIQDLSIEMVTDIELAGKKNIHDKFDNLIGEINSIKTININ